MTPTITIDIQKEDIPYILEALEHRASRYGADSKRCLNGYGTAISQQKSHDLQRKQAKVLDIVERISLQTYDYEV